MKNRFDEFWKMHNKWLEGILTKDTQHLDSADIYFSFVSGEFYNCAVLKVAEPKRLNLEEIRKTFRKAGKKTSFYLLGKDQKLAFTEFLVQHGFKFKGTDVWMVYDRSHLQGKDREPVVDIRQITPEIFPDFYSILSVVFKNFSGNEKYLEICKKSLTGEAKSTGVPDLKSEFYAVYENDQPAAGAGIFYSQNENIAYLHNAGTLEKFRGKGYQSALINQRIKRAQEQNIDRIYSIAELGSQSWHNLIRHGFLQHQLAYVVAEK